MIYLDHAATSPMRRAAREAMLPYLNGTFGNPSGLYRAGREAQAAVDQARADIATVLGATPPEIMFTSGGTESVNTALLGVAYAMRRAGLGAHVVTSAIEHHAGLRACTLLEELGFEVTYVGCDHQGRVSPEEVAAAVRADTVVASVMLANNEVGAIQPLAEIGKVIAAVQAPGSHRVVLHTDAVQAPGWLPLDVDALGVDALSLSAHKFGGPKGVGVLYLRRATPFKPLHHGGGQEMQKRAGTENVPGIVAASAALREAQAGLVARSERIRDLRDLLCAGILARVPGTVVNTNLEASLPGSLNISFDGVESEDIVAGLDAHDIAASSGSACSNSTWEPSHVLVAMGVPIRQAVGAVRFSLGEETTDADIDGVLAVISEVAAQARARR